MRQQKKYSTGCKYAFSHSPFLTLKKKGLVKITDRFYSCTHKSGHIVLSDEPPLGVLEFEGQSRDLAAEVLHNGQLLHGPLGFVEEVSDGFHLGQCHLQG